MTSTDLNALLIRLEVTQITIARALGVTDRTMRRYISGATIPNPVAKLLRLVERRRLNLSEIENA
jgi:DNA-binding transcriptional regulator YiaG